MSIMMLQVLQVLDCIQYKASLKASKKENFQSVERADASVYLLIDIPNS